MFCPYCKIADPTATVSLLQKVKLHILDLSRPRKVVEFANSFVESDQPLDVLVNNAGVMVNQRELTEEGLEKNFCTNTLGQHFCMELNGCSS